MKYFLVLMLTFSSSLISEENKLYKITNGNIDKAVKYKIDRSKAGQKKGYVNYTPKAHTPMGTNLNSHINAYFDNHKKKVKLKK